MISSPGLPDENFNKTPNSAKRPEIRQTDCLKTRSKRNFVCGSDILLSQRKIPITRISLKVFFETEIKSCLALH